MEEKSENLKESLALHHAFVQEAKQMFQPSTHKLKVLNFVKHPDLALPIQKLVEAKGYKETLAHGKKKTFLPFVKDSLFSPGNAFF